MIEAAALSDPASAEEAPIGHPVQANPITPNLNAILSIPVTVQVVLGSTYGLDPYVLFNEVSPNENKAMANLKVRQAISDAIDRSALIKDAGGPQASPALIVKTRVMVQSLVVSTCVTLLVTVLQVSVYLTALDMLWSVATLPAAGLQPKLVLAGTLAKLSVALVHVLVT